MIDSPPGRPPRTLPPAPPRILIAKAGLDGHDRGAKIVARALGEAGLTVFYTGLRTTPEQIVAAAVRSQVACIGLSILSGSHVSLVARVMHLLREQHLQHLPVVLGGIVPRADIPALQAMGVRAVFGPGTRLEWIVSFIRDLIAADLIAADSIVADSIVAGSIVAGSIATDSIATDSIATGPLGHRAPLSQPVREFEPVPQS